MLPRGTIIGFTELFFQFCGIQRRVPGQFGLYEVFQVSETLWITQFEKSSIATLGPELEFSFVGVHFELSANGVVIDSQVFRCPLEPSLHIEGSGQTPVATVVGMNPAHCG